MKRVQRETHKGFEGSVLFVSKYLTSKSQSLQRAKQAKLKSSAMVSR